METFLIDRFFLPTQNVNLHRVTVRILLATDQSLAQALQDELYQLIHSTVPDGYFEGYYDTPESRSKGFKPGYVSFGLRPAIFPAKDLVGGLLFKGTYPSDTIRSNSPDPSDTSAYQQWEKAGGNPALGDSPAEIIDLEVGYYNHKKGRTYQQERPAGQILFTIDPTEKIIEIELTDKAATEQAITSLVDEIVADPPDVARSETAQRKKDPYASMGKFLKMLRKRRDETGSNLFTMQEVKELNKRTEIPLSKIMEKLNRSFFTLKR